MLWNWISWTRGSRLGSGCLILIVGDGGVLDPHGAAEVRQAAASHRQVVEDGAVSNVDDAFEVEDAAASLGDAATGDAVFGGSCDVVTDRTVGEGQIATGLEVDAATKVGLALPDDAVRHLHQRIVGDPHRSTSGRNTGLSSGQIERTHVDDVIAADIEDP